MLLSSFCLALWQDVFLDLMNTTHIVLVSLLCANDSVSRASGYTYQAGRSQFTLNAVKKEDPTSLLWLMGKLTSWGGEGSPGVKCLSHQAHIRPGAPEFVTSSPEKICSPDAREETGGGGGGVSWNSLANQSSWMEEFPASPRDADSKYKVEG